MTVVVQFLAPKAQGFGEARGQLVRAGLEGSREPEGQAGEINY